MILFLLFQGAYNCLQHSLVFFSPLTPQRALMAVSKLLFGFFFLIFFVKCFFLIIENKTVEDERLSVDGRIQKERNVKHFAFQQQRSSRLDLQIKTKFYFQGTITLFKNKSITSGNRVRRSEKRPGD